MPELGVPLFDLEARLLDELAAKAGVSTERYARSVLNAHLRTKVGLVVPEDYTEQHLVQARDAIATAHFRGRMKGTEPFAYAGDPRSPEDFAVAGEFDFHD